MIQLKNTKNTQTFYIAKRSNIESGQLPIGSYTKQEADARFQPKGNYISEEKAVEIINREIDENIDIKLEPLKTDIENNTTDITNLNDTKQDNLESGVSIKTVNGESILGAGNIEIKTSNTIVVNTGLISNYKELDDALDNYTTNPARIVVDVNGQYNVITGISKDNGIYYLVGFWINTYGNYENTTPSVKGFQYNPVNKTITVLYSETVALHSYVDQQTSGKQDKLISGTNIKTINGTSILGSGDIKTPKTVVENILTSTSPTNALSAYQGKILNDSKVDKVADSRLITETEAVQIQTNKTNITSLTETKLDKTEAAELYQPKGTYATQADLQSKVDKVDGSRLMTNAEGTQIESNKTAIESNKTAIEALKTDKQDKLISGSDIKTLNGISLLGAGNIALDYVETTAYNTKMSQIDAEIESIKTQIGLISTTLDKINGEVI